MEWKIIEQLHAYSLLIKTNFCKKNDCMYNIFKNLGTNLKIRSLNWSIILSLKSLRIQQLIFHFPIFVGNKAKERISKRVLQKNKARQIFRKTNARVRVRWQEMFVFRKIWSDLSSCNTRFDICPLALLPIL